MFENFSVLSLPFPVVLRTQLLLHVVAKECLADIAVEQGDAEEIESLMRIGVERIIYYLPADGRDPALRRLEELTELTREYATV